MTKPEAYRTIISAKNTEIDVLITIVNKLINRLDSMSDEYDEKIEELRHVHNKNRVQVQDLIRVAKQLMPER